MVTKLNKTVFSGEAPRIGCLTGNESCNTPKIKGIGDLGTEGAFETPHRCNSPITAIIDRHVPSVERMSSAGVVRECVCDTRFVTM